VELKSKENKRFLLLGSTFHPKEKVRVPILFTARRARTFENSKTRAPRPRAKRPLRPSYSFSARRRSAPLGGGGRSLAGRSRLKESRPARSRQRSLELASSVKNRRSGPPRRAVRFIPTHNRLRLTLWRRSAKTSTSPKSRAKSASRGDITSIPGADIAKSIARTRACFHSKNT